MLQSSSRERLSKMHAMLDQELFAESSGKQNHNFGSKTYSSSSSEERAFDNNKGRHNQNDNFPTQKEKKASSMFQRSLQKNEQHKRSLEKRSFERREEVKHGFHSDESSDSENSARAHAIAGAPLVQSKNALRASRKSELNDLERKLLDLEKKMENISVSSEEQEQTQNAATAVNKKLQVPLNKGNQVYVEKKMNSGEINVNLGSKVINTEGTARFCTKNTDRQQSQFHSNLPLSHRRNSCSSEQEEPVSDSSSQQGEVQFDRYQKKLKGLNRPKNLNPSHFDQEENLFRKQGNKKLEKERNIDREIQRLSIINSAQPPNMRPGSGKNRGSSEKKSTVFVKTDSRGNLSLKKHNHESNDLFPERKTTTEHELLEPIYKTNGMKSKASVSSQKQLSKHGGQHSSAQNIPTMKGNRVKEVTGPKIKNKKRGQARNMEQSFRSNKSTKSRQSTKSIKSVRSDHSHKSNYSKNSVENSRKGANLKEQVVKEKKMIKKVENLEKQLEHYKRLSKRLESQLQSHKLLQMQYRKLETQFKKSEQIRMQQKRIIQNLRSREGGIS